MRREKAEKEKCVYNRTEPPPLVVLYYTDRGLIVSTDWEWGLLVRLWCFANFYKQPFFIVLRERKGKGRKDGRAWGEGRRKSRVKLSSIRTHRKSHEFPTCWNFIKRCKMGKNISIGLKLFRYSYKIYKSCALILKNRVYY